jgi:starch synthase
VNILFATSEAVPFAKTGGLADVSSSLPRALSQLGHQPVVVMPAYKQALRSGQAIRPVGIDFSIPVWNKTVYGSLLESRLTDSDVPVYLILQDQYYDRDGLYNQNGTDYTDNCERFVFFSRAVLETIRLLSLEIDVLHTNDWQTGLIPAYLEAVYKESPRYKKITSVHTIHNLAYQGVFWHWDMCLTGLDWKYFTYDKMEFFGKLNLLKTGMMFADGLTTVSPRYAQEILSPEYSCGLEGVLRHRRKDLRGILNGVDTDHWNPAADPNLAAVYNTETVFENKPVCKQALQEEMQLPVNAETPLVGIVGRLAFQKGLDLVIDVIPRWVEEHNVQWVILGTGDPKLEQRIEELAASYPQNVAVKLSFSDAVAHRIEAGADMFLMPSRYEPCGLNQMYSLIYGTVPIVRETGGLVDTVVGLNTETFEKGTANGFSFKDADHSGLNWAIEQALICYRETPGIWKQLVKTGMSQDWSWKQSAARYLEFYEELRSR